MDNESSYWISEPEFVEGTETHDERYNLHKHVSVCRKNDKHLSFYPYPCFVGKQSKLFRIIEISGNLTVKISVCRTIGKKGTHFGSGMLVCLVDIEELTSYSNRYLFFIIITARHVISNDAEAKNAKIEFFNNEDVSCNSNIARGLKILSSNREGDFIEVLCVTKERSLVSQLKTLLKFKEKAHQANCSSEGFTLLIDHFPKLFKELKSETPIVLDHKMFVDKLVNGKCLEKFVRATFYQTLYEKRNAVDTLCLNLNDDDPTENDFRFCKTKLHDKLLEESNDIMMFKEEGLVRLEQVDIDSCAWNTGGNFSVNPGFNRVNRCCLFSEDQTINYDQYMCKMCRQQFEQNDVKTYYIFKNESNIGNKTFDPCETVALLKDELNTFGISVNEVTQTRTSDNKTYTSFVNLVKHLLHINMCIHNVKTHADLMHVEKCISKLQKKQKLISDAFDSVYAAMEEFKHLQNLANRFNEGLSIEELEELELMHITVGCFFHFDEIHSFTIRDISNKSFRELLLTLAVFHTATVKYFYVDLHSLKYNLTLPNMECMSQQILECVCLYYISIQIYSMNTTQFSSANGKHLNCCTPKTRWESINDNIILSTKKHFSHTIVPNGLILRDLLYFIVQVLKSANRSIDWVNIIKCMNMEFSPSIKSPLELWSTKTNNDLAIHIGHPHGMSKQVTIGEIVSTNTDTGHYTFMYNTPTCPGCSGGPVFVVPREILENDDDEEIQWNKIFAVPHAKAHNNKDKFNCNMSSSWTMYFDDSISETLRLSLTKEEVADIKSYLDSDKDAECKDLSVSIQPNIKEPNVLLEENKICLIS